MTDLRLALRQLMRHPGFTAVAVLALSLGIGVNTAIFTLTNAVLLRPLPGVTAPEQLVQIGQSYRGAGFSTLAHGNLRAFREQSSSFSGIAAYAGVSLGLAHGRNAERIEGQVVSANYFDVLGVTMAAGRAFLPEEDELLNGAPVAVISHGLWQRTFGGDPAVVGRTVSLNARPFTIVGIASPEFFGPQVTGSVDLWVPISMLGVVMPDFESPAEVLASHIVQWHQAFGRLKPGATIEQAEAELATILRRVQPSAESEPEQGVKLVAGLGLNPEAGSDTRRTLGLLQCVVALVLVIACANVANMQLARGAARAREMGIRLALGASRWHLCRQLLTENALLSAIALVTGVLFSLWFTRLIAALSQRDISATALDLAPDWRVLLFASAAALFAALAAGLLPSLQAGRNAVLDSIRDSSTQSGSRSSRLRNGFVIAQIALSLLLLVGAGLFVRTFQAALSTHPGYPVDSILTGSIDLRLQGYSEERGRRFFEELLPRIRAIPGVEAAALAPFSPFTGATFGAPAEADGAAPGEAPRTQVNFAQVTPGFFSSLDLPILQGRDFTEGDLPGSPRVAVLDESTAQALFPEGDAVGRRILMGSMRGPEQVLVVGIVRDVRFRSLLRPPERTVYLAFAQNYLPWATLHVRTGLDPASLLKPITSAVRGLDAVVPVHDLGPLSAQLDRSLWQQRFSATLMGLFGLLALMLSLLGIYGVISYSVTQRTREIGVRMALGAQPGDVARLVLRQAAKLLLIGMAIGLVASFGLGRLISSQLYGVSAADPITFVAVLLILGGAALTAAWLPARKAARVEPMLALRND